MDTVGLIGIGILLLIIIIIIIFSAINHEKGDHKDGGGKKVGESERIPFFAPANDKAGMIGERLVNYHLRPLLREDEYLLANLLLPLKNGYKTEIDCVLISRKGIFCIETKKWVGHVSGSDEDEYWYQKYDDYYRSNRQHKNPVKQNENHCAILERKLNNNYQVDNIVIFVDLEDGRDINSNYVFTIGDFISYYRELDDDYLNAFQVKAVYQMLLPFVATKEELEKHRKEAKERFND